MEHFTFIHGSSEGQSTIIPSDCPVSVCNDISNKYFEGRVPRQKKSGAKISLFIDLYRSNIDDVYCAYSFVNNDCFGLNGRDGQYFAITILCKGCCVYPESVYNMLQSAYNQMCSTGKILRQTPDGKDQYVIAQFVEQKDYLVAFLCKINNAFSNISNGQRKVLSSVHFANYDSWDGIKVNVDNSNSISAYNDLCKTGRIFVSSEYESQSEIIRKLEDRIQSLEVEKKELIQKNNETKHSEKVKIREEVEKLDSQLKQYELEIVSLKKDNENYRASMEIVSKELEKFADVSKSISGLRENEKKFQNKDNKVIRKTILLYLLLLCTVFVGILNYFFFRDISSSFTEKIDEVKELMSENRPSDAPTPKDITGPSINPSVINTNAAGGEYEVLVSSSSNWVAPQSPTDWVKITKSDESHIKFAIKKNTDSQERVSVIMFLDNQIKIVQAGVVQNKPQKVVDFGLVIKDMEGNVLSHGASVYKGQQLRGVVNKPSMSSGGYGWKFYNCTGDDNNSNVKEVNITISGKVGTNAAVGYGDLTDQNGRQRISLLIVDPPSTDIDASISGSAE